MKKMVRLFFKKKIFETDYSFNRRVLVNDQIFFNTDFYFIYR